MKTTVNTNIQKVIDERQTIHLTAMDSFVKTRLKDQDHLVKSELNKVDTTLANNQLGEEGRLESIMDIRLDKYTNIIRKQEVNKDLLNLKSEFTNVNTTLQKAIHEKLELQ